MSRLRTINIPGHAYFVTTKVAGNKKVFIYHRCSRIILQALQFMEGQGKFALWGYVIMPDHIHLLLYPDEKLNISDIMRDFKKWTSRKVIDELKNHIKTAKTRSPDLVVPVYKKLFVDGAGQETSATRILAYFEHRAGTIHGQTYKVWQSRNWITNVYSDNFFEQKLNYIHDNPVRVGFVTNPADFPYSSAA